MNKTIYKVFTVSAFLLLITALFMQGCSKVEENLVSAPVENIGTHPAGWGSPDSASFHGNYLATTHLNISACRQCHGNDFSGGISKVSCYRCHNIAEVHSTGWFNPSDTANFHGNYILKNSWNLENCKSCHGDNYQGGISQKTCYTCHEDGPQGCYVCHGDPSTHNTWPPKSLFGHTLNTEQGVGAHDVHMNPDSNLRISRLVECTECHRQVTNFYDTNHIGVTPGTAEVIFGTLAKTVTSGSIPNPVWNSSTQTCSNVYCHGYFKNGNKTAVATFTNPGSVVCGSCHGNPNTGDPTPGGHSTYPTNCSLCHGVVIDANRNIINKSKHINGIVDFNVKK
jgi:predicted CxxxxCH...CXXCH cytochrome family protein